MEISAKDLSPEALRGLAEELVTREGTDYGYSVPFEDKVKAVLDQVARGEALITWDAETESASLIKPK